MTKTIRVNYLARVEGEGALTIRFAGKRAKSVELAIFEPPRFFEALLRGRSHLEAPDITARICGICPVAYQMSACRAIEDAAGVEVDPEHLALRRLLYCGEWIESHALHAFLLHTPDFLGFPDAVSMAKQYPEAVQNGLRLKKAGNALVSRLGGREIHPVNVRVGGFYRSPERAELRALLPELVWGLGAARKALEWMAGFTFPDFERDYEFVALRHPSDYPIYDGRIVSSRGLDIDVHEYERHFVERQVPHSTALHSDIVGRGGYFCGPLARINLNFERLGEAATSAARAIGFEVPCNNPFKSLLARGLELIHVFDEAARIIDAYQPPRRPFVELKAREGVGHGCTEAPRGILYHRYRVSQDGSIEDAKIVPPTSQNQQTIEQDLFELAPRLADMPHAAATELAERAIRNYDPCISCSTHFLKLKLEQEP